MLSVEDCILQLLYERKKTLILKLINSIFVKDVRGMVHRLLKKMGVGGRVSSLMKFILIYLFVLE